MKRLLILTMLILALALPAAMAEKAEGVWQNEEIIWVMPETQTVALPAANAAAGITLTASPTEAVVGEMVTLTVSAPGAEAVRIYRYTSEDDMGLRTEQTGEVATYSYSAGRAGTDQFVAAACYGGEWTTDLNQIVSVVFSSNGTLEGPAFTAPSSANVGESFDVTVGAVANGERYTVIIYRIVDGSYQEAAQKHLDGPGTLTFAVYDAGEYQLNIIAAGTGWNNGYSRGSIIIRASDDPVPTVTLVSDPADTYYLGSTVTVHVEMEGAEQFISRLGNWTEYDTTYPAVNGQADCEVQIRAYSQNAASIRFCAVVDGENTGFSDAVSISISSIPAPTLSFSSTVQQGETLTITAGNMPPHWQRTRIFIVDESGKDVFSGTITDQDNPAINIDTFMLDPGNYTVEAIQNISDTPTGSRKAEMPLTVTANPNAPAVGTIIFTVSDETLYTGTQLTAVAYAPGADRVRICDGTADNVRQSADGERVTFTIQYNSAHTLSLFAQAAYDGGDWSVTSDVKQVEFISRGCLDAPTFECKTEFEVGESITVTRTNTVENAETYLAFLTTADHVNVHPSINFNGGTSVTFDGIDEPGEYTVSVLAMAPGWSNNQTELTITVVASSSDNHCGENVTWSLSDDGTLTISGTGKMFSYYSEATPWGYDIKKVIVEPGVTVVGGNAFMNCYNLKSVQLPAGLKRIGQRAFSYCYNMEEVNLPDSLESIGACAFMGCEQLQEVVIPAGIENIGFGTFQSCVNIKKVSLPTGLTRIGKYAFASCLSLEALVIPDSVTDIDSYAFVGGRDLKAIRLPDTLSHIGDDIFGGRDVAVFCNSASATSQWAKGQGLTVFPLDKNIIVLPEDIKTVESEAFAGLSEPTTVVIPDTVEYIARDAFSDSTVAIRANDGTEGANYAYQLELPRFPD